MKVLENLTNEQIINAYEEGKQIVVKRTPDYDWEPKYSPHFYFDHHQYGVLAEESIDDLEINQRIMVRNSKNGVWRRRYFAGIDPTTKKVLTYGYGATEWSATRIRVAWEEFRTLYENEF